MKKCSKKSTFTSRGNQEAISTANKNTEDVSEFAKNVMKARKDPDYDLT